MGNNFATRCLLLTVALLAASLVGLIAGWFTWAAERHMRNTVFAASGAFAVTLTLVLLVLNFLMRRDN